MREEGDAEKAARLRRNDAIDEDTRSRIADERSYLSKIDICDVFDENRYFSRKATKSLFVQRLFERCDNVIDLIIR